MKKKTPSIFQNLIIIGSIDGPSTADPLPSIDCSETALTRCFNGTRLGTIACLQGISNDKRIPLTSDIAIRCQGKIRSVDINNPVNIAVKANMARVTVTSLTLFIRSAITPPHIDSTNIGTRFANVTKPNIISESVKSYISQRRPAPSNQIPILEVALPIQKIRYSRKRKDVNINMS